MQAIATLLKPRIWPLKRRGSSRKTRQGAVRLLIFGTVGFLFWGGHLCDRAARLEVFQEYR